MSLHRSFFGECVCVCVFVCVCVCVCVSLSLSRATTVLCAKKKLAILGPPPEARTCLPVPNLKFWRAELPSRNSVNGDSEDGCCCTDTVLWALLQRRCPCTACHPPQTQLSLSSCRRCHHRTRFLLRLVWRCSFWQGPRAHFLWSARRIGYSFPLSAPNSCMGAPRLVAREV